MQRCLDRWCGAAICVSSVCVACRHGPQYILLPMAHLLGAHRSCGLHKTQARGCGCLPEDILLSSADYWASTRETAGPTSHRLRHDRAESDASQGCRLAGACGNRGSVASSPLYTPAAVQALLPDERPRGGAVQGDQDRCRVEVVAHGDGVPCAAQQGHRTAQCVHSPLLPCQCIPSKNIKSNSNLI
jgi:hypothetical protein